MHCFESKGQGMYFLCACFLLCFLETFMTSFQSLCLLSHVSSSLSRDVIGLYGGI